MAAAVLYAERLRTLVADWIGTAAIPDVDGISGATVSGGSLALSSASAAMFVRNQSAAAITGWKRQTWHTKIYNVKNYGAVGDNATDDRVAIRAAIAAASTAGGGTVYFPPGEYYIGKGSPTDAIASFQLDSTAFNQITFLGDGAASKLRLAGSAGFGDMVMFRICNGAAEVSFENLTFDAAQVTNPDPGEQLHFLQFQGRGIDTIGAVKGRVQRCYIGRIVGDGVRFLGEAVARNDYFQILENDFNMVDCRSCVSVQRYSSNVVVSDNYLTGSDDNLLDMEPTAGGDNRYYTVARNILNHESQAVHAMTLTGNGAVDPFAYSTVVDNLIVDGGGVRWFNVAGLIFAGNIIHENGVVNNGVTLGGTRRITDVVCNANVVISESGGVSRLSAAVTSDAIGQPQRMIWSDNVCYASRCGVGVLFEGCSDLTFAGNVVVAVTDGSGSTAILSNRATNFDVNNFTVSGNVLHAPGAGMTLSCSAAASPFNLGSVAYLRNLARNAGTNSMRITRSTIELFTGVYAIADNLLLGATSSDVDLPNTNIGAALAGNASTDARKIACLSLAAGPEGFVSGGPGALCVNALGVQGLTTFLKESGLGTAGWRKTTNKVLWAAALSVGNQSGTRFMPAMTTVVAPRAATAQLMLPRRVLFRNFRVAQTPGTGAGNNVFTIRVTGVAQALAITVPFTATGGSVTLATPLVAAAGLIDFTVARSVAPTTAPTNVVLSMECD